MTLMHPAVRSGIARLHGQDLSADNTAIAKTITIKSDQWPVLYALQLNIDVLDETDLEVLPAVAQILVTMSANVVWDIKIHPLITHTGASEHRWVDLGPWSWGVNEFGEEGLYGETIGQDIVINVPAMGALVKAQINYRYSGG